MPCHRQQPLVSSFRRWLFVQADGLFFVRIPVAIPENVVFVIGELVVVCLWIVIIPEINLIILEQCRRRCRLFHVISKLARPRPRPRSARLLAGPFLSLDLLRAGRRSDNPSVELSHIIWQKAYFM